MVCDKLMCDRWCVTIFCVTRDQGQPSAISAMLATQSDGRCDQVPRLPRRTKSISPSAMHATQNEGGCHQVPRLPRKSAARSRRPKRATRPSPVPKVPRLPRKAKADVTKCHACDAKCKWTSPSATLATQKRRGVPPDQVTKMYVCVRVCVCVTKMCDKDGV